MMWVQNHKNRAAKHFKQSAQYMAILYEMEQASGLKPVANMLIPDKRLFC